MAELILELYSEEIPPKLQIEARNQLKLAIQKKFEEENLTFKEISVYSSPTRLSVFVKDIPEDDNDMEITAAIIAMAQKLKLDVVAEGVETIEQVEFLQNNNCFIVQGYYFSKPVAEDDIPALFDQLAALKIIK